MFHLGVPFHRKVINVITGGHDSWDEAVGGGYVIAGTPGDFSHGGGK